MQQVDVNLGGVARVDGQPNGLGAHGAQQREEGYVAVGRENTDFRAFQVTVTVNGSGYSVGLPGRLGVGILLARLDQGLVLRVVADSLVKKINDTHGRVLSTYFFYFYIRQETIAL